MTAPTTSDSFMERIEPGAGSLGSPKWGTIAFLIVGALILPQLLLRFGAGTFIVHMMILFFLWSVVAQSWNLVLGVAGIYSFAQLALFAVGGWVSALLSMNWGWNPWVSLVAASLVTTATALLIGLPTLRLRGVYVVLLTLAFHQLLGNLAATGPREITGGGYGLLGVPRFDFGPFSAMSYLASSYYLALLFFVLATLAIWRIFYSPIGAAFSALRDSEGYAVGRGINQFRIKLFLFGFSAFFTGLAGGLMTHYLGSISSSLFSFSVLINVLAMIVIGGWGSFGGPILGTALLLGLQEGLRDLADLRTLVLGLALAAVAVLAPAGVWPKLRDWFSSLLEEPDRSSNAPALDGEAAPSEEEPLGSEEG